MTRNPLHFAPTSHTRARGNQAEHTAVRWLKNQGFRILERNHRNRAGEIDVIALDGETLCFIEVKARAGSTAGPAIEAVHLRKQMRLARAASVYLASSGWEGPCRFDVLGLDRAGDDQTGTWTFTLIEDAFSM